MNALVKSEAGALAMTDAERLRMAVTYDPSTGVFRRKITTSSRAKAGDKAGCLSVKGYLEFNVLGRLRRANRLAWLYVHGQWPNGTIDHKDGDRANNAIDNLRDVSNRTNGENRRRPNKNNSTGKLGVRLHKMSGKYEARIRVGGVLLYLGLHVTPDIAHAAYVAAKRELHAGSTL